MAKYGIQLGKSPVGPGAFTKGLGKTAPGPEASYDDLISWARVAERRGFDFVDLTEPPGAVDEPYTGLVAVALATRTIQIGPAVSPIHFRGPVLMASHMLNLHLISNGRAMAGLGWGAAGGAPMRRIGVNVDRSIQRMREYIQILKLLFAGGRVTYQGRYYRVEGVSLVPEGAGVKIPIYIGAGGDKALQLVGELADGVYLPTFSSYKYVVHALEQIRLGAQRAGRTMAEIDVIGTVEVCVSDDVEASKRRLKELKLVHFPSSTSNNQVKLEGLERERDIIKEAMSRGDLGTALAVVTDEILDKFCVYGSVDECRQRMDRFGPLGVARYRIHPNGRTLREAIEGALQLL